MNHAQHRTREKTLNCPMGIVSLFGALFIMMSGCSNDKLADLEQYVQQVKSRSQGTIDSLPKFKPRNTFTYQAAELRSPFAPSVVELPPGPAIQAPLGAKSTIQPDQNRRKEALEEYTLDSLKMVGILEQAETIWAIIRTSDGILYRVKAGNHMGRHYGRVTHINEEKIELTEIVPDEQGGWLERQTTLALAE